MTYYSQLGQDVLVDRIMQQKVNGTYLDVGASYFDNMNNSYFFEKERLWRGVAVEIDDRYNNSYSTRKSGVHLNEDALKIDYKKQFQECEFPNSIDYLSLDVDTLSLDVLNILPFDEYNFKVITIEHDGYLYGDKYRKNQRDILTKHGYILLCSNVYVEQSGFEGKECPFEDWWVDSKSFDKNIIKELMCDMIYPSDIISKFK